MSRSRAKRIFVVSALAAGACAIVASLTLEVSVPVLRATRDLAITADGRTLAVLPAGIDVAIEKRRDDKHAITPLVAVGDRTGEPAAGDYMIERRKRSLLDGLPIISCRRH